MLCADDVALWCAECNAAAHADDADGEEEGVQVFGAEDVINLDRATAIAKALRGDGLTALGLGGNGLGRRDAVVIAEALHPNS
eukprot:SAG11_NODE_116_length_16002_cov_19.164560_8_plen_83_part_00